MIRILRRLLASDKGATAVEYGLIIAMIVLAMLAALTNVATKTNGMWGNVANEVTNS
ncbi:MAG: Flp family type IVb pilin [Sphingobium sp.]|nr:Flp family type IVb pilin [Sphingobium sp.]